MTARKRPDPATSALASGKPNLVGAAMLYRYETMRFMKIFGQSVIAPTVNAALFMMIFTFALGGYRPEIDGVPFTDFLAPGLVMMAILQNAFANIAFALLLAKIQGNIVDLLMPPLSPMEMNLAFAFASLTRGLIVGLMTFLMLYPFVDLSVAHPGFVLYYAIGGALTMSFAGTLCGVLSEKFDHLNSVINFFITPLVLLSGTFYSISQLPDAASWICLYNPFFYIIDGFRYGFTGRHESDLAVGMTMIAVLTLLMATLCHLAFKSGYRLKQ